MQLLGLDAPANPQSPTARAPPTGQLVPRHQTACCRWTVCGGHAPCLLCLPSSQLQVFFGVCVTCLHRSLTRTHTHVLGHLEEWMWWSPLHLYPYTWARKPLWRDHAENAEKRGGKKTSGFSGPLHPWTVHTGCLARVFLLLFRF